MAEREIFMQPGMSETERQVLDRILKDDGWIGQPRTISLAQERWPSLGIFKVSISVERVK